jgi:hypothetical protein
LPVSPAGTANLLLGTVDPLLRPHAGGGAHRAARLRGQPGLQLLLHGRLDLP